MQALFFHDMSATLSDSKPTFLILDIDITFYQLVITLCHTPNTTVVSYYRLQGYNLCHPRLLNRFYYRKMGRVRKTT